MNVCMVIMYSIWVILCYASPHIQEPLEKLLLMTLSLMTCEMLDQEFRRGDNAKVNTCTQPHKRVGLQQGRDEGLGICGQGVIALWPHYIVYQRQQRQRNVSVTWEKEMASFWSSLKGNYLNNGLALLRKVESHYRSKKKYHWISRRGRSELKFIRNHMFDMHGIG